MLWRKAWIETRTRFALGLLVLTALAWLVVIAYTRTALGTGNIPAANHERYLSFVRGAWFGQALPQFWCLFAILLASGGLLSQAARGGALFTLSLPVTRQALVLSRVAVALAELYLLALLPSLALSLLSPLAHETYGVGDALVHSVWLVAGGAVFFALPFFIASITSTFWIPVAVMLTMACLIAVARNLDPDLAQYTLAPLLTARAYFTATPRPWMALVGSIAVSVTLIALATRNLVRRDF